MGTGDIPIAMVTGNVAITVELELEEFGEGVEKRFLRHQCVGGGTLQNTDYKVAKS